MESAGIRWAEETFGKCDLGDSRRRSRLIDLCARLAESGGGSVASACGDAADAFEGGYRFVRNPHVAPQAIAEGGFAATAERAVDSELLLCVQDTTNLSYSHSVWEELGDLGGPAQSRGRGWLVHNTLLLDGETGGTVGLIDQERWMRPPHARGRRHRRKESPYEEKESFKWQSASERVRERLGPETMQRVIVVCDREADVYEYLEYQFETAGRFVVRSSIDRRADSEAGRLWSTVGTQPPLGIYEVALTQRGGQKNGKGQQARKARRARAAEVTVRAAQVKLQPPYRPDRKLSEREIWIVQALEESPPEGEEGLEWLLLTTEPVDGFERARRVIGYYERRWRIEELHKVWKTGCRVEDQRHQTAANLERMSVILIYVAVRLLQLKEARDVQPEQPCTPMLGEAEWKCLWMSQQKQGDARDLPEEPPSCRWAYDSIARLGGFQDTKRTGRVGWSTFWKGWNRLAVMVEGFELARRARDVEM